ncbi:hypothetical protein AB4302_14630 [Vibrio breoganii]|nr:hypothetical protein [Vibrio breoganii]
MFKLKADDMKRLLIAIGPLFISCAVYSNQTELQYYEPQLSFQISQSGDSWVGTVSGTIQATEQVNISADIDSTGYLELGTGYGVMFGDFYTEAFISYGRADIIDIYSLGAFSGTALNESTIAFLSSSYEWRSSSVDIIDLGIEEWKNTVGVNYSPIDFIRIGYSFNYDRKITEGGYRTNQDVQLTLRPKWVQPYFKYIFGEHRSTPSSKVTSENSYEFGVNFSF